MDESSDDVLAKNRIHLLRFKKEFMEFQLEDKSKACLEWLMLLEYLRLVLKSPGIFSMKNT
jgi:hypothetical protein